MDFRDFGKGEDCGEGIKVKIGAHTVELHADGTITGDMDPEVLKQAQGAFRPAIDFSKTIDALVGAKLIEIAAAGDVRAVERAFGIVLTALLGSTAKAIGSIGGILSGAKPGSLPARERFEIERELVDDFMAVVQRGVDRVVKEYREHAKGGDASENGDSGHDS